MPTLEISNEQLQQAVSHLSPSAFQVFWEQVQLQRATYASKSLSHEETQLLDAINQGLSFEKRKVYKELREKRREGVLSVDEHQALIVLSDEVEMLNAQRIEKISVLASLRNTTVRALMQDLGLNVKEMA